MNTSPPVESRTKRVIIRVTKAQQRRWRNQAKQEGKRFCDFLRDVIDYVCANGNQPKK